MIASQAYGWLQDRGGRRAADLIPCRLARLLVVSVVVTVVLLAAPPQTFAGESVPRVQIPDTER
jgi:hypothetical protein